MTDLKGSAAALCRLQGRRMTIEQLFRDPKINRKGWSPKDTQITRPERLDRLLLILAIAYLLLCGIGLIAQATFKPSAWSSASRNLASIFQIGLFMPHKTTASPSAAFNAALQLSQELGGKWG